MLSLIQLTTLIASILAVPTPNYYDIKNPLHNIKLPKIVDFNANANLGKLGNIEAYIGAGGYGNGLIDAHIKAEILNLIKAKLDAAVLGKDGLAKVDADANVAVLNGEQLANVDANVNVLDNNNYDDYQNQYQYQRRQLVSPLTNGLPVSLDSLNVAPILNNPTDLETLVGLLSILETTSHAQ
ncbi:hypothetical protein CONCODRAFT_165851 [Conidiobolus coronatus NRRL 28638]|uniref:Uncharacterized protein n=1 Tax=Conidiobolus coronatus (strain ATCC 28846 / CBS 209.66 / NRRL 28638) TaxID=796925 RepID=A0A137P2P1_CONC2|nr:hypothetical protein CONCODRAFT_165851 [Conidiobolus coronatus NRRL 28638]|eukprot:KXN69300.1 hypothetical protein CONCODRAFT_165851 [Conidiobolus coronatus NRRL 28638]